MPNIRELGQKVQSLRNMQKVMRAMNMIASIKLRKILGQFPSLQVFQEGALDVARDLALAFPEEHHVLIHPAPALTRVCVMMFTSDKGLCGSHNNTVQRSAASLVESLKRERVSVDALCIGRRGEFFCRRNGIDVHLGVESNARSLSDAALRRIAGGLIDRLEADDIQEVHVVYNAFVSTLQQTTMSVRLLPLCGLVQEETDQPEFGVAMESADDAFLRASVSTVVFFLLQSILRHSHLSEHAARMTAMDNATNNSDDLIARYTALRNRARQTAITSELSEIVAGKEALKD